MLAPPLEEGTYRLDVGGRIRVENENIVEVGCHLFQALDILVDNIDLEQVMIRTVTKLYKCHRTDHTYV